MYGMSAFDMLRHGTKLKQKERKKDKWQQKKIQVIQKRNSS